MGTRDIRSDVESVTRFSVIESKISLKNERRSRCISTLLSGIGKGGREWLGNARKMRFRSRFACKIDLPSETAALLEFDIACIHCTSHPVVNVKRIKYFLAADGPEKSNVTTDGAAHIRGFCSRIKINRTPILGRNDCTFACAFILVAICTRVT